MDTPDNSPEPTRTETTELRRLDVLAGTLRDHVTRLEGELAGRDLVIAALEGRVLALERERDEARHTRDEAAALLREWADWYASVHA